MSNELVSSFDALHAQNTSVCNEIKINIKDTLGGP
jgi:hypothetical protein